jgi:predicted nicotinamide N-methyase
VAVSVPVVLRAVPLVPELRLYQAAESADLWELAGGGYSSDEPPPFWAFAWAGGQALARYLLDHPELVAGRRVVDVATGSGLVAIAAAKAGAANVTAVDVDPAAVAAAARNAHANGVTVAVALGDAFGQHGLPSLDGLPNRDGLPNHDTPPNRDGLPNHDTPPDPDTPPDHDGLPDRDTRPDRGDLRQGAPAASHASPDLAGPADPTRAGHAAPISAAAADLVLAGDACYTEALARRLLAFARRAARNGATVLIGDPDRGFLPRTGLRLVAEYDVPTPGGVEERRVTRTHVWAVTPPPARR